MVKFYIGALVVTRPLKPLFFKVAFWVGEMGPLFFKGPSRLVRLEGKSHGGGAPLTWKVRGPWTISMWARYWVDKNTCLNCLLQFDIRLHIFFRWVETQSSTRKGFISSERLTHTHTKRGPISMTNWWNCRWLVTPDDPGCSQSNSTPVVVPVLPVEKVLRISKRTCQRSTPWTYP